MKVIIFLCLTIAALIQGGSAENEERQKLAAMAKKCEKEYGDPKDLIPKVKKGEDIGDENKAGRMALCINVKMGHMDTKGEVVQPQFTKHVRRLTKDKALLAKIIRVCGKKNGKTPEIAALNFVKCMVSLVP